MTDPTGTPAPGGTSLPLSLEGGNGHQPYLSADLQDGQHGPVIALERDGEPLVRMRTSEALALAWILTDLTGRATRRAGNSA